MATQESMAIRVNEALESIERSVTELLGADIETLPRLGRDRDMLRVTQIEQIAKWLSEIAEAERVPVKKVAVKRVAKSNALDSGYRKPRK